jgi:hypothetical protein
MSNSWPLPKFAEPMLGPTLFAHTTISSSSPTLLDTSNRFNIERMLVDAAQSRPSHVDSKRTGPFDMMDFQNGQSLISDTWNMSVNQDNNTYSYSLTEQHHDMQQYQPRSLGKIMETRQADEDRHLAPFGDEGRDKVHEGAMLSILSMRSVMESHRSIQGGRFERAGAFM